MAFVARILSGGLLARFETPDIRNGRRLFVLAVGGLHLLRGSFHFAAPLRGIVLSLPFKTSGSNARPALSQI